MPRALVIEDDEVTARDIVAELRAHGLAAEWVADGREGLARALADGYDIITLDRMLPGMDGIDAAAIIRSRHSVPIVFISGRDIRDEVTRRLSDLEAVEILAKPVDANALCEAIRRAHSRPVDR